MKTVFYPLSNVTGNNQNNSFSRQLTIVQRHYLDMDYGTAVFENVISTIDVNVVNVDEDVLCRCTNDPHVTTFDQRYD